MILKQVSILVALASFAHSRNLYFHSPRLDNGEQCPKASDDLPPGLCARAFDGTNCNGPFVDFINYPYPKHLLGRAANSVESVIVQKGCTFRGFHYERRGPYARNKEADKKVVLVADQGQNLVVQNLDEVPDQEAAANAITEALCTCPEQQITEPRKLVYDRTYNSTCPTVPAKFCAIAYDEENCDKDDWVTPLDIPETDHLVLNETSVFRDAIESVSVGRGCTLTLSSTDEIEPTKGSVLVTIEATPHADKHVNLDESSGADLAVVKDSVRSMSCSCGYITYTG